jgi:hypothetical protein
VPVGTSNILIADLTNNSKDFATKLMFEDIVGETETPLHRN